METYETTTADRVRQFLLPSLLPSLLVVLVSTISLIVLNLQAIWDATIGQVVGPQGFSLLTSSFFHFSIRLNTPFLALFWAMLGALAYSIIWMIQNITHIAHEEAEQSHYLLGGKTPDQTYWRSTMEANISFLISFVCGFSYLIFYFLFILPACSKIFYLGVYDFAKPMAVFKLFAAILLNTFALYTFSRLYMIIRYCWHNLRRAD